MAQPWLLDIDQEQRNFFCLTILIYDVGNKRLREYFKSQWPTVYQKVKGTPPPAPWTNVPNDAAEMNNIETGLRLKPKDKAKFDIGNTEKWDFSLLSSVLLYSSLGFVNPSSAEESALEDLKDVRNELVGHNTSSKIDDATFKSNWIKACNALKLFGATQTDFTAVEDVLEKPSDTLVPILKKIAVTEEDICQFVQEVKENYKDIIEKMSHNQDELKAIIKEEARALLEKNCEGPSLRPILLAEHLCDLLQECLPDFQDHVIATHLFKNLPCLTQEQKDQIAHDEKNYQTSKGVRTLVEKLKEHKEGFEQFVKALCKADLGHVALLLDADFEEHNIEDKIKQDEEEANYSVVGTGVVDLMILMSILDDKQARQFDLEQKIASSFCNSLSEDSKTLRKDFQKVLPKGVYFVHTKPPDSNNHSSKKYSVKFAFRVAKVSILEELWKMYNQDNNLKKKIHKVLSSRKTISRHLSFEIMFQENDYNAVRCILQGNAYSPSMKTTNTSVCLAKSMSDQEKDVRQIRQQAHLLARDIVCYRTGRGRVSTSITARNLRRVCDELEDYDPVLWSNMCNELNITTDSAHEKFVQIADVVFEDRVNWGRIAALFAFGGKLAQFCLRNGMQDSVEEIEHWVGEYVAGLSSWIQKQGGWDSFDKLFQDPSTRNKSSLWTGILFATIGIGSLATFVYKQC